MTVYSPFFVVGSPRSGTTLFRLMLDSHVELTCCEEFQFLVDLVGDDGSTPNLPEYANYLKTRRVWVDSGLVLDPRQSYVSNVHNFFTQRLALTGKTQVGSVIHYNFTRLLHLFPDARFIYLLRDPRDVAQSIIKMGWAGNAWYALDRWLEAEAQWGEIKKRIPENRWIEVRYCNLINNHTSVLEQVCEFLGISFSTQMLKYHSATGYGVPDSSRVSVWRRESSVRDIQFVEARVGDRLVKRGFKPSGLRIITPSTTGLMGAAVEHKLWISVRLVKKYGARLVIERWLTNRLPAPAWRRSVQERFTIVNKAGLIRSWPTQHRTVSTREECDNKIPTRRASP